AQQAPQYPAKSIEEFLVPGGELELLTRARILLGKAQFADNEQDASTLSGGWKKRLDIVQALMNEPDLLLLDEPTNHMDLEGIVWLEKFLLKERISTIIVSHDRYFLEKTSNRIIEINPCYPDGLFNSDGTMSQFLEHKK